MPLITKISKCFIFYSILTLHWSILLAQNPKELYGLAMLAEKNGEFFQSEKYLLSILELKENIKEDNQIAVYNQLGIINKHLGRYQKAIKYYIEGENIALKNIKKLNYKLPSLYNNLGNIFWRLGDYNKSLEYFQEALNNLNALGLSEKERNTYRAHAFNNTGLVYYEQQDYLNAMYYIKKRMSIGEKYNLLGQDVVIYNYARCMRDLDNYDLAETYFEKCIKIRLKKYGEEYYKLARVYKAFGKLKLKIGNKEEALGLYKKAHKIYKVNYGEKHPRVAEILEVIGDYYLDQKNNKEAINYYQKSLIANAKDFNSTSIYKNPQLKNIFSEVQLLKSLKKKSEVLALMATEQFEKEEKKKSLKMSISTLELAMEAIKSMRHGYLSRESKLYITQNEKAFYMMGIENALQLYELTSDNSYLEKSYQFSRSSKAAVLIDEISQNEAFEGLLPDSLKEMKNELLQNIASHKKLIFDEHKKLEPSQSKVSTWQSELFKLNKNYERILKEISDDYPEYSKLQSKKDLLTLSEIQQKLEPGETLIEYSYSLNNGKGQLYTFFIAESKIKYYRHTIDSTFERDIDFYREKMNWSSDSYSNLQEYNKHNQKLYSLYSLLIKPLDLSDRKNIIIVPDEKIAYISFDALISEFKEESIINYAGLPYLLFDYNFSYAYSTNLLFKQNKPQKHSGMVYAFAPSYHSNNQSQSRNLFGELKSAKKEIESILKHFKGTSYTGDAATKSNFKSTLKHGGIYHLAMHANSAKENPDYSYLAFSGSSGKAQSSLMYNYEIGNIPMNASMLVLSACNTGDGDLYSGEGVMSLSRGFILAGIQSVVHGLWKINDESSSIIMESFYKHLSEGKSKSEALQLAKIDFIENASPELANPKYWAGIVLMGNHSPLVKNNYQFALILSVIIIVLIVGIFLIRTQKIKSGIPLGDKT